MSGALICTSGYCVDRPTMLLNIERTAGGLAALHIGAGDCVALLLRNSVAFVEITLGVGRLGAFAVPINWHFTVSEIGMLLDDCEPQAIFVDEDLAGSLPPKWAHDVPVIQVRAKGGGDDAGSEYQRWRDASLPFQGGAQTSPGSIVYTSGTTGRPKGVKRLAATADQRRAMRDVRARLYHASADDRVLVPGPLYHAFPNQFATHAALHAAHVEIMPKFDAEDMLRVIERERITSVGLAPIMFVRLLRLPDEVRKRYDLSSLRWAIHAGGPCPNDVKRAMIGWWGPIIAEYYGGTETGPLTLCTSGEWLARPGTCGRPIDGVQMRIVDAKGVDVAIGEPGEIYGRLTAYPDFTYHNDPEKRQAVGLGELVSLGDVGYRDADGYLYLRDRIRDMVVSGGVNIYPAEVESALLELPGVEDCAVFAIPDAEFGEAVAAVVAGRGLDAAALRKDLRLRIAGYKVPREIAVVSALNRDPSGKLRKADIRDRFIAERTGAADKVEENGERQV